MICSHLINDIFSVERNNGVFLVSRLQSANSEVGFQLPRGRFWNERKNWKLAACQSSRKISFLQRPLGSVPATLTGPEVQTVFFGGNVHLTLVVEATLPRRE